jgi:hypothetical protein
MRGFIPAAVVPIWTGLSERIHQRLQHHSPGGVYDSFAGNGLEGTWFQSTLSLMRLGVLP